MAFPFNPKGRIAAILKRRLEPGLDAFVFGSANGTYQPNMQTARETLRLLAHGVEPKPGREGMQWNREQLERIDLRWHDLRHEGAACWRTESISASFRLMPGASSKRSGT